MKLRGLSVRCFHGPSQRNLVLDSLSFRPDITPNSFSMSKAFCTDIRLLQMRRCRPQIGEFLVPYER